MMFDRGLGRYRGFWGNKRWDYSPVEEKPLLQIDFLIALFTRASGTRDPCTLDTSALPFRNKPRYLEKFDKLMAVTDLVLLDIKGNQRRTAQDCH